MPEINACPICHKQPVLQKVEGYPMQYKFFCGTHVSVGDWFPNTLGAELDWNRRTTDPDQPDFYKPTNSDRIRNANDEDLPDEILRIVYELFEDGEPSRAFIDHWLRQPAENKP